TRKGTVSVFNGPEPAILTFRTQEDEARAIATWIRDRFAEGVKPDELGIFVRSQAELERVRAALTMASVPTTFLDDLDTEPNTGTASLCTMHLAKGLEFRAVVIAACDDEVVPLQSRIEQVTDDSDLQEVYNTER